MEKRNLVNPKGKILKFRMSELFKDLYSKNVLEKIAISFSKKLPTISQKEWIQKFKQKDWEKLELRQRIRRIGEFYR
ncbi:hypothetical protein LEP1GSC043_3104 [Leptospira weilii str. Ecochallenge]|uniref:Uncharacterized protein n=4 Tax=Leptospira weilii TaxID=28184 RepID=N1U2L8_9LEPT|nr:hypothetical protein LEP1GSC108_2889 [Leptospira weilii str. UI 13098]EMY12159.1 hypothetical protein LEP1GSC043_3104 [Leptospira weilii str. Ecochallenge]